MGSRFGIGIAFVLLFCAAAGAVGFNLGVSHGMALAAPACGARGVPPHVVSPVGFGFGPLLFLFFFFFVLRPLLGRLLPAPLVRVRRRVRPGFAPRGVAPPRA